MVISKIGQQHIEYGTNCQDFGIEFDDLKIVCDGCSEGKHSEVGVKLFCYLMPIYYRTCDKNVEGAVKRCFEEIFTLISKASQDIRNYLCFTILICQQCDDRWKVYHCGDGYIIEEKEDGKIRYTRLDDGEYPKYYAYNYVESSALAHYQGGVSFTINEYDYPVGVASDGLRYVFTDRALEEKFTTLLLQRKESAIRRLINKHQTVFKDDITVVL